MRQSQTFTNVDTDGHCIVGIVTDGTGDPWLSESKRNPMQSMATGVDFGDQHLQDVVGFKYESPNKADAGFRLAAVPDPRCTLNTLEAEK